MNTQQEQQEQLTKDMVEQFTHIITIRFTEEEIQEQLNDMKSQQGDYFDYDVVVDYDVLKDYSPIMTPIFFISFVIVVLVNI